MADGKKFVRVVLIIFNVLFLIGSVVIIALAAYAFTAKSSDIYGNKGPLSLIATTAFLLIASILGLWAAVSQSKFLLFCYSVLLILVFLVDLVLSIFVLVIATGLDTNKPQLVDAFRDAYNDAVRNEPSKVCTVFKEFSCSGFDKNILFAPEQYPSSCPDFPVLYPPGYARNCYPVLRDDITSHIRVVGGVSIGITVLVFLFLVFTCVLFCSDRIQKKRQFAYAQSV
mmetsp:Transcript_30979/g.50120  ORF Transcript_30979/g.50120 Transcript_30979/m.50120 type:complete len:227 (-) Transcript_30979:350-1030(-)|eukprot:CAMPEP_0184648368 /NCGR_PEP_ID=MMETSP0308-20130426/5478_1 /TAXON_ID=38269 /ORGANISM="Gloeochaete witrockiana, Strain SAG 46.84" /LENGTH=226 /DNA_ID=CAMNT_0027080141 /DNA_START=79 /DNA_END=759 /DNA_ORIENTATION=-